MTSSMQLHRIIKTILTKNKAFSLLMAVVGLAAAMLLVYQSDTLYAIQDYSVWRSDLDYFVAFLDRPLGLLQWTACLLTQFFYYPALGVLMLALLWTASGVLTIKALRQEGWAAWTAPLPVFCLFVSFAQTGYWLYLIKLSAYWYLFTLLWLWWAVMLMIVCRVKLMVVRVVTALAWCCVLLPWNGLAVHPFDLDDAFKYTPHYVLAAVLALQLVQKWWVKRGTASGWMGKVATATPFAVYALAVVWSVMFNYRYPCFHAELRMQQAAEKGDWDAIVREVNGCQRVPTRQMVLLRDLALLHTGQLYSAFPPNCRACRPAMVHGPHVYLAYTGGPVIYYLAGYVNDAYRWEFENGVEYGFTPQRLRMLLLCSLQNHEWELSRKYVRLLNKTFFHKTYAEKMARYIGHPELFKEAPELMVVSRVIQKDTHLTPANIYMEPILFTDPTSPLKNHYQWHFQGQGKLQTY